MTEREEKSMQKERKGPLIQSIPHHTSNIVDMSMYGCQKELGHWGLMIDAATADRISKRDCDVYRTILSAEIQSHAAKLLG